MNITYKIIDPRAQQCVPKYATALSAGLDLHALLASDAPLVLLPGMCVLISTGLAIYIEHPGYMGMLVPRSGLGHKHGIVLGNGTGIIDADYQGEIKVSLVNRSDQPYTISPFERVAQLLIVPVMQVQLTCVDAFAASSRGVSGFGSTGK